MQYILALTIFINMLTFDKLNNKNLTMNVKLWKQLSIKKFIFAF